MNVIKSSISILTLAIATTAVMAQAAESPASGGAIAAGHERVGNSHENPTAQAKKPAHRKGASGSTAVGGRK